MCDMWHIACGGGWTFSKNFNSNGLGETVIWRYFHKGWLIESVSQSINDEGVGRTAPAPPGLVIMLLEIVWNIHLSTMNMFLTRCYAYFKHKNYILNP